MNVMSTLPSKAMVMNKQPMSKRLLSKLLSIDMSTGQLTNATLVVTSRRLCMSIRRLEGVIPHPLYSFDRSIETTEEEEEEEEEQEEE